MGNRISIFFPKIFGIPDEESSKVKKMMQFAMALRRQKFEVQKNFLLESNFEDFAFWLFC